MLSLNGRQPALPADVFNLETSRELVCAHLAAKFCLQRAAHRRTHAAKQVSPFACFLIYLRHNAKKVTRYCDGRRRQPELGCLVTSCLGYPPA